MTAPPSARRLRAALLPPALVAGVMLLASCAAVSVPTAGPVPGGSHPVVLVHQALDALDVAEGAVGDARIAGDTRRVGARAVGPFLALLQAQLKGGPSTTPGQGARDLPRKELILTAGTGWPRWFAVVGQPAGQSTPTIRVLVSPSVREPYGIYAEAVMLPGAAIPRVAPAETGAPALPADASGLVATPQQAVAGYADLLAEGAASPTAARYVPDDKFATDVRASTAQEQRQTAGVAALSTTQAADPQVLALQAADGSAVVVGSLTQTYDYTVRPGAGTLQVQGTLATLAGRPQFAVRLHRVAQEVVVLRVPLQGRIELIAAGKSDVSATGT